MNQASGEFEQAKSRSIGDAISAAIKASRSEKRHPLEVTSDRIGDAIAKYGDRLSGADKDTLSAARFILEDLADGS